MNLRHTASVRLISLGLLRSNWFGEGEGEGGSGGEGGNQGGGEGGGTGQGNGQGNGQAPPKVKTFTQDQVNAMLAKDRKASQTKAEQAIQQLEALRDKGLTEENLEALNGQIEELRNQGKTQEQLAADKEKKLQKQFQVESEKIGKERDNWKNQFTTYKTKTEVLTAAQANKAYNADQVYQILAPSTYMTEVMDENGKGTGDWVPKVKLNVTDDDGKSSTLDLTVTEAVKKMKEMAIHANLFDSGASSGLGGNNIGGKKGTTAIPKDMNEYMAARKKNPNLLRNA